MKVYAIQDPTVIINNGYPKSMGVLDHNDLGNDRKILDNTQMLGHTCEYFYESSVLSM